VKEVLDLSERAAEPFDKLGLELLLHSLQSPINTGMILRVAETYHFNVTIFDSYGILEDPEKLQTITDFACGAVERRGFRQIFDQTQLESFRRGRRLIGTSVEENAVPLSDHAFVRGDIIVLGNEYDGLPDDVVAASELVLQVPMPAGFAPKPVSRRPIDPGRAGHVARDGKPNLNVAMTAAIICYSAFAAWRGDH